METSETELVISSSVAIPLAEIHFEFVRSSGPGGQNVNKVNSQAQLHWNLEESTALSGPVKERLRQREANRINKLGVMRIDCQTSRDREKNRQECLNRLKEIIVRAMEVPKARKKTRTPRWVKEKRLRNKKEKSKLKRLRRPPSLND
ncbi:alternative ribosome rescue aminoacyl-tRNA hydrolase ArfB [Thalassoglobus polymorphus]|uniref:Peptidyl-tRNA hydrolase ArfB n=1 Tax=Thalassoglobus polymorphus TaxID=2527994 RepID=A0A517QRP1_9PLAN|nr:alternative ribosome rescue aminoacyl-tRNA hydrolase ArfB [Thalassoglobus polymorphus]QDT34287.1 Peptidyl-tRNA hydrolase ArfB [Thalassoglobus polymorphus]